MTWRAAAILVLALGLAGCSSTGELQRAAGDTLRLLPFVPDRVAPRYAALDRADAPALLATDARGTRTVLRRAGSVTWGAMLWLAPDGAGYTFQEDGILVATRGAAGNLMAADVTELATLMRTGQGGTAERFHAYLDGEGGTVLRSYVCTVTQRAGEVLEDCAGLHDSFTNSYRKAPDGGMLSSRQHPDPGAGAIRFQRQAR